MDFHEFDHFLDSFLVGNNILILTITLSAHSNKSNCIFPALPPPSSASPFPSLLSTSFISHTLHSARRLGTPQRNPDPIKLQTDFLIPPLK